MLFFPANGMVVIWALTTYLAFPLALVVGYWIWRRYRQWQLKMNSPSFSTSLKFFLPIILLAGLSFLTSYAAIFWHAFDLAITQNIFLEMRNKKLREVIAINRPVEYGSFQFPSQTRLIRYDVHDNGETNYPLVLNEIVAAYFPMPTPIAGVLATGVEWRSGMSAEVRLAKLTVLAGKPCPKGALTTWDIPQEATTNESVNDWDKIAPAEAEAFFHPAKWQFRACNTNQNNILHNEDTPIESPIRLTSSIEHPRQKFAMASFFVGWERFYKNTLHHYQAVKKYFNRPSGDSP